MSTVPCRPNETFYSISRLSRWLWDTFLPMWPLWFWHYSCQLTHGRFRFFCFTGSLLSALLSDIGVWRLLTSENRRKRKRRNFSQQFVSGWRRDGVRWMFSALATGRESSHKTVQLAHSFPSLTLLSISLMSDMWDIQAQDAWMRYKL